MGRLKYLIPLIAAIVFIFSGCDGSAIKQSEMNDFIGGLKISDKFGLEEFPWSSSKQSVSKNIHSEVVEESSDSITTVGELNLPESIDQRVTYKFQDDQFLLVTYGFETTDEKIYSDFMTAIGQAVSDVLLENDTIPQVFEVVPNNTNSTNNFSHNSKEDNSNLNITVSRVSEEELFLGINILSPSISPSNMLGPTNK